MRNRVRSLLEKLQEAGWTDAAVAREIGVTGHTVWRWRHGVTQPRSHLAVESALEQLSNRRRIPRRRHYIQGHYLKRRIDPTDQTGPVEPSGGLE